MTLCILKGCEQPIPKGRRKFCSTPHAQLNYNRSRKYSEDSETELFWRPREFKEVGMDRLPDGYRVIIVNDLQRPFHAPRILEAVEKFWDDLAPDLEIYNGDIADFYLISDHDKNPSRRFNFQNELDDTHGWLYQRATANPHARRLWDDGNHEDRMRRWLWHHSAELASLRVLTVPELLGFEEMGIEWLSYGSRIRLLGFLIEHGNRVSGGGVYTNSVAPRMARDRGSSGMCGHTHKLGKYPWTDSQGTHAYYENGCLCQTEMEYMAFPNWQHGFSYGVVHRNKLHVVQVSIYPDGFYAEGEFYPIVK